MEKCTGLVAKKHRRSKKLFLLLLLLVLTGIFLSTSTYAWFTANRTVSTQDVQVNVAAENGIQISADGTTWKAVVQVSDLLGASNGRYGAAINQIPSSSSSIAPVSSGLTVTDGKLDMFYGVVETNDEGDYILTATKETDTDGSTGRYIAFDLFFKVDATTDTKVYLTTGSGVTASGANTGIKNASRIAFVDLGNVDVSSSLDTVQGITKSDPTVYLWEPNYDVHTGAAVVHADSTYDIPTTTTGGSVLPYSGIINTITRGDNILVGAAKEDPYSTLFKDVTPTHPTEEGFDTYKELFTLKPGITKIRIYMWVEGQDVDCETTASGGDIIYKLQISTESAAAGA